MRIRVAVNDQIQSGVCVCVCSVYLWVVLEQILSLQEPRNTICGDENAHLYIQQAMNHDTYQIVHRISLTHLNKALMYSMINTELCEPVIRELLPMSFIV